MSLQSKEKVSRASTVRLGIQGSVSVVFHPGFRKVSSKSVVASLVLCSDQLLNEWLLACAVSINITVVYSSIIKCVCTGIHHLLGVTTVNRTHA